MSCLCYATGGNGPQGGPAGWPCPGWPETRRPKPRPLPGRRREYSAQGLRENGLRRRGARGRNQEEQQKSKAERRHGDDIPYSIHAFSHAKYCGCSVQTDNEKVSLTYLLGCFGEEYRGRAIAGWKPPGNTCRDRKNSVSKKNCLYLVNQ